LVKHPAQNDNEGEMTTQRIRTAAAAFETRDEAERAVDRLRDAGFDAEQVGWAMRGEHKDDRPAGADAAAVGAGTGAVVGGAVGAAGAAAAMALIPGLGPFLAGGYLGTVLIATGGGAVAGGLLGGLTGMGMDEDEATYYDEQFRAGRVVVTVNAGERYTEAADILRDSGGQTFRPGTVAAIDR
jgi:hypothetical protein